MGKNWIAKTWFPQAKFGIFVHWGIYAVNGRDASWPFYFGEISYRDYMKQKDQFRAENYDPTAWAALFKRAGARYAVLTSKHHDGFALWPTQAHTLNAAEHSPAGRDLVGPWVKAMRVAGLKAGLYYSLLDWSHPDYPTMNKQPKCERGYEFSYPPGKEDPRAWARFLKFMGGQLQELQARYKPDLFWFDGDWERSARQWHAQQLRATLKRRQPKVVLNARLQGYGDYETPEQAAPLHAPGGAWEFCMTMNDSWGYQRGGYKSLRQLLRTLTEIAGLGGNLLLNVGPQADGRIPREAVERLEGMGAWLRKNGEAVFGTVAGLPAGHLYGASTLSRDRKKLYAFLYDRPRGEVAVKGLRNRVRSVKVLHSGKALKHRVIGGMPSHNKPGVLWIGLKDGDLDRQVTVLKLELEGPLDLYTGLEGH